MIFLATLPGSWRAVRRPSRPSIRPDLTWSCTARSWGWARRAVATAWAQPRPPSQSCVSGWHVASRAMVRQLDAFCSFGVEQEAGSESWREEVLSDAAPLVANNLETTNKSALDCAPHANGRKSGGGGPGQRRRRGGPASPPAQSRGRCASPGSRRPWPGRPAAPRSTRSRGPASAPRRCAPAPASPAQQARGIGGERERERERERGEGGGGGRGSH